MKDTIGIIGAGHLGLALGKTLINRGLDKSALRLSSGGSEAGLARIEAAGLTPCLVSNRALCKACTAVIVAVRPTQVESLSGLRFRAGATVVAVVAGVSRGAWESTIGRPVSRAMVSGPDSIEAGQGMAALFPDDSAALALLRDRLGIETQVLAIETSLHAFTAAMCLPPSFLQLELTGGRPWAEQVGVSLAELHTADLSRWRDVVAWARGATPVGLSSAEKQGYIARMATPGGITEVMVGAIVQGAPITAALNRGMKRSWELAG
jgi:pyrroline-5-carboxylate reductase